MDGALVNAELPRPDDAVAPYPVAVNYVTGTG